MGKKTGLLGCVLSFPTSLLVDGFTWKTPFLRGKKEVMEEDDKTLGPSEFLGLERQKSERGRCLSQQQDPSVRKTQSCFREHWEDALMLLYLNKY